MAFAKRIINLRFQLAQGSFQGDSSDTIALDGFRCSANITKAGGVSMSNLDLKVWGIPLADMNTLTVLNKLAFPQVRYNNVTVLAGDELNGVSVCFQGTIQEAWADGRNAPDVMFHVSAFSGLFETIKPVPPTSYSDTVDVALVVSGIAQQMGLNLENSGVEGKIATPYLPGSLGAQLKSIAQAAHINYFIDREQQVLAIWPKGQARDGKAIELSPETGMIGYPSFTQNGIQIMSVYNPSLVFGRVVSVKSDFTAANGNWVIASISHNLDAGVPNGLWFTEIECTLLGQEVAIIG